MAVACGIIRASARYASMLGLCAGCATPNLYTTPRATQVGKLTSTIAPQLVRRPRLGEYAYAVVLAARLGLAPRLDAGARTNLASAAADIKWNAIRTRDFDLALDAGVELMPETLYVNMPVLLGINLGDAITLVPSTGITLGNGTQPSMSSNETYDDGLDRERSAGRLLLRAGLGVQARITPTFAVQPELTYVASTDGGAYGASDFFAAGVGFTFGPQPY